MFIGQLDVESTLCLSLALPSLSKTLCLDLFLYKFRRNNCAISIVQRLQICTSSVVHLYEQFRQKYKILKDLFLNNSYFSISRAKNCSLEDKLF